MEDGEPHGVVAAVREGERAAPVAAMEDVAVRVARCHPAPPPALHRRPLRGGAAWRRSVAPRSGGGCRRVPIPVLGGGAVARGGILGVPALPGPGGAAQGGAVGGHAAGGGRLCAAASTSSPTGSTSTSSASSSASSPPWSTRSWRRSTLPGPAAHPPPPRVQVLVRRPVSHYYALP
jgi:hypothetical protein